MPRVVSVFPNSQGCRGNGISPILYGRHAHLADISIRFDLDERQSRTATEETLLKSFTAGAAIYDESYKPSPRSLSAKGSSQAARCSTAQNQQTATAESTSRSVGGRGGQLGGNPNHTAAVPCVRPKVPSPHAAMGGGHRYSDISLTIAQRFSCTLHLENARAIAKRMPDERVRLGSTLSSQVLAWTM